MRIFPLLVLLWFPVWSAAQPVLKQGDRFPSVIIRDIINAPVSEYDVQKENKSLLILNFWGTWCTPCLPEMDSLSRLQTGNKASLRVIAVSDEPASRLKKYLQRRPASVWLASDSTMNLYRQFAFNYVGQAAIINRTNQIVALVRTDSINQPLIDRLLRNEPVNSSAETGNKPVTGGIDFSVDSSLGYQVAWSSYRAGVGSMRKTYPKTPFEGRRTTYYNVCITSLFQDAYGVTDKQVVYEVPEKTVCNWNDKSTLYCLDLLVKPEQKDSLLVILRQTLDRLSPLKARPGRKVMPVYVLRRRAGAPQWKERVVPESTYSFSGQGFEGKGITLEPFTAYISNELELPVIDETGLKGKYNITTRNDLRTKEDIVTALQGLGLLVEKTEREMPVIYIH